NTATMLIPTRGNSVSTKQGMNRVTFMLVGGPSVGWAIRRCQAVVEATEQPERKQGFPAGGAWLSGFRRLKSFVTPRTAPTLAGEQDGRAGSPDLSPASTSRGGKPHPGKKFGGSWQTHNSSQDPPFPSTRKE